MTRKLLIPISILGFTVTLLWLLSIRFYVGVDPQVPTCLWNRWYVVDTWDQHIQKGDLVAYTMFRDDTQIPKGTRLVKIVQAEAGDHVQVYRHFIQVNDQAPFRVDFGDLPIILEQPPEAFERTITIPEGHVFLTGETEHAYDSRFWGPVPKTAIIGRAYVIL